MTIKSYDVNFDSTIYNGPTRVINGIKSDENGTVEFQFGRAGYRNATRPCANYVKLGLTNGKYISDHCQDVVLIPNDFLAHRTIGIFQNRAIVATHTKTIYLTKLNEHEKYIPECTFTPDIGNIDHVRMNDNVAVAGSINKIKYIELQPNLEEKDLTDKLQTISTNIDIHFLEICKKTLFIASKSTIVIKSLKNLEVEKRLVMEESLGDIQSIHVIDKKRFLTVFLSSVLEWEISGETWQKRLVAHVTGIKPVVASYGKEIYLVSKEKKSKFFKKSKRIFQVFKKIGDAYQETQSARLKFPSSPKVICVIPGKTEGKYFVAGGNGSFMGVNFVTAKTI